MSDQPCCPRCGLPESALIHRHGPRSANTHPYADQQPDNEADLTHRDGLVGGRGMTRQQVVAHKRWTWRCLLLGHAFYWLDVNRRHHCRRCGVIDRRFVLQNRRIQTINTRFGCDCPECVISPASTDGGSDA